MQLSSPEIIEDEFSAVAVIAAGRRQPSLRIKEETEYDAEDIERSQEFSEMIVDNRSREEAQHE